MPVLGPSVIEDGWVLGLLPTLGQLPVADVIDVCGPVFFRLPLPLEPVESEDHAMLLIGQHVMHFLLERPAGEFHHLANETQKLISALIATSHLVPARHVEGEKVAALKWSCIWFALSRGFDNH